MSKNKDSDNEVDIYGDLPNFSADNTISELEKAKTNLENELKALQLRLNNIEVQNKKLKKENEALSLNISSLYKTAACEIRRKDQMIQELRREKDSILFRRHRNDTQNRSRRHDAQPEEVHVIDDYQPSAENEVCIIGESRQQDYASYQYADEEQYDKNYGEDEGIATFPEENEHYVCKTQNIPQKVPDTIFSRRKAQQLMKMSDSVKDSNRVGVRSEDSEIIIEDPNKTQSTIFDRRKNQMLKSYNEQHDISKVIVEVDTAHSPAFIVKGKSSTITSGTKNIHLSHKKTELSTSKHSDTVRKIVEANIKTFSKVNELQSSMKASPSSRTEELRVSKTTSHHNSKEHSDVDKRHRKKSSHVSRRDKRSGSNSHSHRKSSSHSKSKFSNHSSSHRSPAKNSISPKSMKGRSRRETSVSRALQSLRSKLKLSDSETSRSLKERDRHKEVENKGSKNRESQEHKKTEHISSKLIPEKSQPETKSLPGMENVCTESKLASDTVKTMIIPDSKTASINQDIYMTTKSHIKKQHSLQGRLAKYSEKEEYITQADNTAIDVSATFEESLMEVQTDKMSHKEDNSKAMLVTSKPHENIIEVQQNCGVLTKEGSAVMIDKKMLDGEVPTNSDELHEVAINKSLHISQKDSIGKVSQQSDSSENENSLTPMDIDLPPKKCIDETAATNREVSEDEQHKESVRERLTNGDVLCNKGANEEAANFDSMHKEDIAKVSSILAERSINASEGSNIMLRTILPSLESQVGITDILLKSKDSTNNMIPTELKTQTESVEALEDTVTTNQEDATSSKNSDLSTDMHDEENTLNSHHENLQNTVLKDRNKTYSIEATKNSVEIEPLERPIDAIESGQVVSSTLQTEVEEGSITQAENVKPTIESVEALQDLVTTNQEDLTSPEKSDLSADMHDEENTLNSYHENLQNTILKDQNKNCSVETTNNFVETEPLEGPNDAIENGQVVSSTLQTDVEERSLTPTEVQAQAENVEPTTESVALQDLVTTTREDVTSAEKSDLSTDMHNENNTLNNRENLQNAALKERNINCSIKATKNFVEINPLERPIDATENGQVVSSTLQADVEERNISSGISQVQSAYEERNELCNPSLQEVVSESLTVEKEHTKSVNQSLPNPNESLSQTATFKKGNISFAIMNEPGCFRRRKFKRISSDNLNNTGVSTVIKNTSDEHLHNENLSGTKRPYERLETESSVSPPVKKQTFADPHRDQLYPSIIEDKPIQGSSQGHFECNGTRADEKNTSTTEINTSNDKNNASDLEEGEIEDSDSNEESEGNKKLNKDVPGAKVLKSVIHIECNVRKEQSGKYLEKGRKVRENRRKPRGSHLQEVNRGNCDRHLLPKQLFSHCERRSPSELLIKDRNIKLGTKEKDQNSRSRSTSSETSRNTNEFTKNEKLKAINSSKENKVDTKSHHISEEKRDKTKASSTSKLLLQNMPVNKPDLSAWTRLGTLSIKKGANAQNSSKENTAKLNGGNQDSFKIPTNSSQTIMPITKYIIKRRKVCNLQDNVSVPVVNISPPKPITTVMNEIIDERFKSVHSKIVVASNVGLQASQVNLIPHRKTDSSTHSKEMLISKTSTSASRRGTSQTDMNCSRISPDSRSVLRSRKTLTFQMPSDSSISSSSFSEYENNSDETWRPRRRKRKRRKNPKTEVTKNRSKAINL